MKTKPIKMHGVVTVHFEKPHVEGEIDGYFDLKAEADVTLESVIVRGQAPFEVDTFAHYEVKIVGVTVPLDDGRVHLRLMAGDPE